MAGQAGATKSNATPTLHHYGIEHDKSDYRAHVCFKIGMVYIYPTRAALTAIARQKPTPTTVYRSGIPTARGYLIAPANIPGCLCFPIPSTIRQWYWIAETDDLGRKGQQAAAIVRSMLLHQHIHLKPAVEDVLDIEQQIAGIDLKVNYTIQVKCDYSGGDAQLGGTGNIFIQTHERNLNKTI